MRPWISVGLAVACTVTALACQSGPPTAAIIPVALTGQRILDQTAIMAGSKGWGCWPSGIVAAPDGYWFSARAPGRLYRVEGDRFAGSSSIDQDVVLESVTRIGDVEYLVDCDRHLIVAYRRGQPSQPVTRPATMVGTDAIPQSSPDGTPTGETQFDSPLAIAATPDGALIVSETATGKVRRLDLTGAVSTLMQGMDTPTSVAVGPDGRVFAIEAGRGRLLRWDTQNGPQVLARDLQEPDGVAVTADGTAWVTGTGEGRLLAIRPDGREQPFLIEGLQDPGPIAVDGQTLLLIDRADSSVWRTAPLPAIADRSS